MRCDASPDDQCRRYLRAAEHALCMPITLLAIVVLLVNDHFLKSAAPSWLTGKLSDFAGLYFSPFVLLVALFAALCLVQWLARRLLGRFVAIPRRALDISTVLVWTCVLLTWLTIKLTPIIADPALALIERTFGVMPLIVVDPTDLLALVMLPLACRQWRRQLVNSPGSHRWWLAWRPLANRQMLATGVWVSAMLVMLADTPATRGRFGIVSLAESPDQSTRYAALASLDQMAYFLFGRFPWQRDEDVWTPGWIRFDRPIRLYRSSGGGSWEPIADGGLRIVPDPLSTGRLYLSRPDGIWRVDDGRSASSERIWPPSDQPDFQSPRNLPRGLPILAAPWRPAIYLGVKGAILRSDDAGVTWTTVPVPSRRAEDVASALGRGEPPPTPVPTPYAYQRRPIADDVAAIAAAPSRPDRLFALNDALIRSDDGGDTWQLVGNRPGGTVLAVHPRNADALLIGGPRGLSRSTDGGRSWDVVWTVPSNLPNDSSRQIVAIRFDPARDSHVVAVLEGALVLSSEDDGQSWTELVRDQAYDALLSPAPDSALVVAAGMHGVLTQHVGWRWPWQSEWEPQNTGLQLGQDYTGLR